ncbi:hypothetical protein ACEPP6_08085 [Bacillus rugosus]|uniref:hypothetical protein n=1 Tax=Bacillus rugosus TaxID=2715209 RepID=UPI0035A34409
METFVDFLNRHGYEASSSIHEILGREVLSINGESILAKDIEKTPYFPIYRQYLLSKKEL